MTAVCYDIPVVEQSDRERQTWRTSEDLPPSKWAERYRVLAAGQSARPGPWRNRNAPYLVGIMDACRLPGVRRISIKKAAQIGVSEALRNVIGCLACDDPDPAMLQLPTESKGREIFAERLLPMFSQTEALRDLDTGRSRDAKTTLIRLINGFVLWLAWSGSPTALASHPIRYLINDEINKFPPASGAEGDPLSMAEQRVKTYEGKSVVWDISSPTYRETGISRLVQVADAELHYWVPCPRCGERIELTWETIKYRRYGAEVEQEPTEWARRIRGERAAWYECPECSGTFTDREKPGIVRRGFWATRRQIQERYHEGQDVAMGAILTQGLGEPRHIGMVIESMPALWVRCYDLAAKWVQVQHDANLLMDCCNGDLGRDFERQISSSQADLYSAKCAAATWPPLVLPPWTGRLLMTVDIQGDHAWSVIRAWGPGLRSRRIWHGCVPWPANDPRGAEELTRRAFATFYPFEDGKRAAMACDAMAVDTGYRTEEMYLFGMNDPSRIYLFKGASREQLRLAEPRRVSFSPPGVRDPLAVWLYLVDGDRLNDWLAAVVAQRIKRTEGTETVEVDQWELNQENDQAYNRMLASEHKVMQKKPGRGLVEAWVLKEGMHANHYRDCERYQRALAYIMNVELLTEAALQSPPPPTPRQALTMPDGRPYLITER